MSLKTVCTEKAPKAVGPYSQAIKSGNFLFTSGQLPINPSDGELVSEDIEKAARQSLENVKAILEAEGYKLEDVVKTNVFLKDMNDFAKVNKVYEEYFNVHKPARSCVEVARLPKDGLIEIEVVAFKEN